MKLIRVILIAAVALTAYACVALCAVQPWFIVVFAVAAAAAAGKKTAARYWACGTASWADAGELASAGMTGPGAGMLLGHVDAPRPKFGAVRCLLDPRVGAAAACGDFLALFDKGVGRTTVRLADAVHTAVFAPTGVGKGVSCVIPHLLACPDSCVVVDFKGENFRITAEHRRKAFGHKIVRLDPFGVCGESGDTFNPLDFIAAGGLLALDECRDLSEALVTRTGLERDPHWADSAELWIASMIAVVVQDEQADDRSLQTVRKLLTNPEKMQAVIGLMCGSDVWGGMLSRLGHQLTQFKEKELGSVLTTTNRFLRFLDTLAVSANTKGSTFDPADLAKGRMTVYLILPPEHMRAQSPLLRMWIGSLLRAVVQNGLQEENRVHFVLDEAASLGHMDALDDVVDKFRGYGVRLQFYYQSLGQLKKCFPEGQEQTLLSNTTQVYFGVNDLETAKMVSERLGEETIVVRSGGTNTGWSRQSSDDGHASSTRSGGASENWNQSGRALLRPDEVMALPDRIAITFTPGVPPIRSTLSRYYEVRAAPPGRRERLWSGAKVFARSAVILFVAAVLALGVSAVAREKAGERRARPVRASHR